MRKSLRSWIWNVPMPGATKPDLPVPTRCPRQPWSKMRQPSIAPPDHDQPAPHAGNAAPVGRSCAGRGGVDGMPRRCRGGIPKHSDPRSLAALGLSCAGSAGPPSGLSHALSRDEPVGRADIHEDDCRRVGRCAGDFGERLRHRLREPVLHLVAATFIFPSSWAMCPRSGIRRARDRWGRACADACR